MLKSDLRFIFELFSRSVGPSPLVPPKRINDIIRDRHTIEIGAGLPLKNSLTDFLDACQLKIIKYLKLPLRVKHQVIASQGGAFCISFKTVKLVFWTYRMQSCTIILSACIKKLDLYPWNIRQSLDGIKRAKFCQ